MIFEKSQPPMNNGDLLSINEFLASGIKAGLFKPYFHLKSSKRQPLNIPADYVIINIRRAGIIENSVERSVLWVLAIAIFFC